MKNATLNFVTTFLVILVLSQVWSLEVLQAKEDDNQDFLIYQNATLLWSNNETKSGSNTEGVLHATLRLSLRSRINRILYSKSRLVLQANNSFTSAQIQASAPGSSCLVQADFCPHLIDLGIRSRNIPTSENSDEPPTPYLA
jgi:hypothetical protein